MLRVSVLTVTLLLCVYMITTGSKVLQQWHCPSITDQPAGQAMLNEIQSLKQQVKQEQSKPCPAVTQQQQCPTCPTCATCPPEKTCAICPPEKQCPAEKICPTCPACPPPVTVPPPPPAVLSSSSIPKLGYEDIVVCVMTSWNKYLRMYQYVQRWKDFAPKLNIIAYIDRKEEQNEVYHNQDLVDFLCQT